MKYLLWLFIPILLLGQVKTVTQTGVKRSLIRGDATTLTWTVTGDYSADSLLFIAVDNDSNAVLRLTTSGGLTASYSSPNTTITGTIHAATTENFIAQNYLYDISSVTDSVTLIMGLLSVIADVSNLEDTVLASVPYYTVALDTPAANNNFIVGMDNRWYQKTLAQTRTILGIDTITGAANLPDSVVYDSQISDMVTKSTTQTITGQKNFSVIKVGADTADVYKRISQTVNIEEYIGAYDTSQGWSLVIQAAVDANLGTGASLLFDNNKVYELQVQKDNPYESFFGSTTCIDLKTGGLSFIVPSATTLKLKDDQMTGTTLPVDIIVFYAAEDLYIGGGGRITGNTAGQTGWTGGYEQQANGRIIGVSGHGEKVNNRITIENLRLDDHFSNPIDINGGYDIDIRNIKVYGTGEGIQLINIIGGTVINCIVNDSTDVFVGDGIELSACRFFVIDGCKIMNNGAGGAFDLISCSDIILTNFFIHKWGDGISPGVDANNIFISDGIIDSLGSPAGTGIGTPNGRMIIDNVTFSALPYGLQLQSSLDSLVIVKNCLFRDITGAGMLITAGQNVSIENCDFINGTYDGVQILGTLEGVYPDVRITNCNFMDNQRAGVYIYEQNVADWLPEGFIVNCLFKDNVSNVYKTDRADNIILSNNTYIPAGSDINEISTIVITTGILDSLGVGNDQQLLTISFEGDAGNGYAVYDWRVSGTGGDNIQLYRAEDAIFEPGDKLTLQYNIDSTRWYEVSRSYNTKGGEKFTIDGWYFDDVGSSLTDQVLWRGSGTISNRFYFPKDGYFTGLGVVSDDARIAGTLTATLWVNGTTTNNKYVVLDGSNTIIDILNNGRYNLPISQGDYLDIRITTSSDWSPTTANIQAWIEVEY